VTGGDGEDEEEDVAQAGGIQKRVLDLGEILIDSLSLLRRGKFPLSGSFCGARPFFQAGNRCLARTRGAEEAGWQSRRVFQIMAAAGA